MVLILLGRFALQDAESAQSKGLHLLFAGETENRGKFAQITFDGGTQTVAVGHAAGQNKGIDFKAQDGRHGTGILAQLIGKGIKDQFGFGFITVKGAGFDFAEVAGAQIGEDTGFAAQHLFDLLLGLAREAG